jgi:hypothetical protein
MSKEPSISNVFYGFLPTEVEGFDSLAELALDMRWSWNHAADEVWRQLAAARRNRTRWRFFSTARPVFGLWKMPTTST